MSDLIKLQQRLGYHFNNETLLIHALTHRSVQTNNNNERLEFLGDSVLSLVISQELFHRYPESREGELSRLRAVLVKGETIAKIALMLGIDTCLQMGIGELKSGGKQRESILAGAFEAVLGAIYCDSDFVTAKNCVFNWYRDRLNNVHTETDVKDAKSTLQEWLQAKRLPLPCYKAVASGQAHEQTFYVTCHVDGFSFKTHGESTNRRKAEQIAAKKFLDKLNDIEPSD